MKLFFIPIVQLLVAVVVAVAHYATQWLLLLQLQLPAGQMSVIKLQQSQVHACIMEWK